MVIKMSLEDNRDPDTILPPPPIQNNFTFNSVVCTFTLWEIRSPYMSYELMHIVKEYTYMVTRYKNPKR